MTGQRWTAQECADALGITVDRWYSLVSDARKARTAGEAHWAPDAVGHNPVTGRMEWDADAVRTGGASRPGQGARTDLHERNTP